jgi:hypothetical protein
MKLKMNNKGFSLVEIAVAGGLLGGLALLGASVSKNMIQGQKSAETKMEELEMRRQIISLLSDRTACTNTFSGSTIGSEISSIKNVAAAVIFQTGSEYGNGSLKINSMTTTDTGQTFTDGTRSVNLTVSLTKLKTISRQIKNPVIPLRVRAASASSPISYCFADSEQIVTTSCLAAGGIWNGSSCSFDNLYVRKSGDSMAGDLTAPQFNGNINATTGTFLNSATMAIGTAGSKVTSPQFCTGSNCKAIGDLALSNQECPFGQVTTGVKADGLPNCRALQCPANQFFAGLDGASNPICRPFPTNICPTNQYIMNVNADGTVNCGILPNNAISTCPSGQILQSINAGIPTCVDLMKISCEAAGGSWNGSNCSYDGLYVMKTGYTMTGILTAPQFNGNLNGNEGSFVSSMTAGTATVSNKITSALFCTGANCKTIGDLALSNQACPGGQVVSGTKPDGTPNCKTLQCSGSQFFAGLDGGGSPVCRPHPTNTCPTNQYVTKVNDDGTVACSNLPNNAVSSCPAGQVLQSINAGVPTCVNKGGGTSCSPGQIVTAVAADGTVTCTTPPPQVAGGYCSSGQVVVSISASGVVTCSSPPSTIVGGSCGGGQFVVGINANGTPICGGDVCTGGG